MEIKHIEDEIVLSMESAEIDEEEIKDYIAPSKVDIILSKDDRIRGKLHIAEVKNIKINDKAFSGILKKMYDYAGIFDFEIKKNTVELSIKWGTYSFDPNFNEFSVIEIEAEKIYWENIPDLEDN
jgi:hypothetical protein